MIVDLSSAFYVVDHNILLARLYISFGAAFTCSYIHALYRAFSMSELDSLVHVHTVQKWISLSQGSVVGPF